MGRGRPRAAGSSPPGWIAVTGRVSVRPMIRLIAVLLLVPAALSAQSSRARNVVLFLADAGGRVFVDASDERVVFAATVPI